MNDTQTMLRAIINGQNAFRQEVLGRIDKIGQRVGKIEQQVTPVS